MMGNTIIPRTYMMHFYYAVVIGMCVIGVLKWWLAALILIGITFLQIIPPLNFLFEFGLNAVGIIHMVNIIVSYVYHKQNWMTTVSIIEMVLFVVYCFMFSSFAPFPEFMFDVLGVSDEWDSVPEKRYFGGW